MTQPNEQRISEIKEKSKIGRVVRVQANTVHDLMADIRLLLSELDLKEAELQSTIQLGLKYQQDREKLIEGLKFYANERRYQASWYAPAGVYTERAREILTEIGVDVHE